jgi:hypothetical protein
VGVGHGAAIAGANHVAGLGDFEQRAPSTVGVVGVLPDALAPCLVGPFARPAGLLQLPQPILRFPAMTLELGLGAT